jgi:hypothetical protein
MSEESFDPVALIHQYFPDADDATVQYILWNKTGWPCFFQSGILSLEGQLEAYKAALDMGMDVCEYCSNKVNPTESTICSACKASLDSARAARRRPA